MAEQDQKKGGQPIEVIELSTPPELRDPVFGAANDIKRRVIPWLRLHELQLESLRQVAIHLLSASPAFMRQMDLLLGAYSELCSLPTAHAVMRSVLAACTCCGNE